MLKLQRELADGHTTIRLMGRIQGNHLDMLELHLREPAAHATLDLSEVTLVDITVIRALLAWERSGVPLVNTPPYIREWIDLEAAK